MQQTQTVSRLYQVVKGLKLHQMNVDALVHLLSTHFVYVVSWKFFTSWHFKMLNLLFKFKHLYLVFHKNAGKTYLIPYQQKSKATIK